jgi:tellurite resistance protein TehA-like permease
MGTGIVSVALLLDHRDTLSDILLVICAVIWVMLAWLLPARAIADPDRFEDDLTNPRALTSIAGTGVLGTRVALLGWSTVGAVLLVVALVLWIGLVPRVLSHWRTPTIGASFLLTVATDSLALLAATLAAINHAAWLLYAALVPFCLALALYVFVLSRFQFRQLVVGRGDHWVTGGALAISTLAAGRLALAVHATGALSGGFGTLKTVALVLWCLTMAWLPALLICEVLRPRLGYTVARWSTVFPFGMYAACSFVVGKLTQAPGITDFARVWVWVAAAVWTIVFAAMLTRAPGLIHGR